MGGETYITITEKGEDISTKLLQELIAYGEFANMNKRNSDERVVPKGVAYDPGIKRFEKRLAERISEINSQYEDELETIGDE